MGKEHSDSAVGQIRRPLLSSRESDSEIRSEHRSTEPKVSGSNPDGRVHQVGAGGVDLARLEDLISEHLDRLRRRVRTTALGAIASRSGTAQ
jgi:hypothetical protein